MFQIFQSRHKGHVSFNRSMAEYENGFGSVYTEYWLGMFVTIYWLVGWSVGRSVGWSVGRSVDSFTPIPTLIMSYYGGQFTNSHFPVCCEINYYTLPFDLATALPPWRSNVTYRLTELLL